MREGRIRWYGHVLVENPIYAAIHVLTMKSPGSRVKPSKNVFGHTQTLPADLKSVCKKHKTGNSDKPGAKKRILRQLRTARANVQSKKNKQKQNNNLKKIPTVIYIEHCRY